MIVIASNNKHKINELSAILNGYTVIPVGRIFPDFDPEETGDSFLENSLIKASALYDRLMSPEGQDRYKGLSKELHSCRPFVLADDSGIAVDALGGKPGIYSARFGREEYGKGISAPEQNSLLLSKLSAVPQGAERSARYICCMALIVSSQQIFTVQEHWEGEIAMQASQAKGGFGYDPIFFLPEKMCTAAEISAEEKNRLSHRAKAMRTISAILASLETAEP